MCRLSHSRGSLQEASFRFDTASGQPGTSSSISLAAAAVRTPEEDSFSNSPALSPDPEGQATLRRNYEREKHLFLAKPPTMDEIQSVIRLLLPKLEFDRSQEPIPWAVLRTTQGIGFRNVWLRPPATEFAIGKAQLAVRIACDEPLPVVATSRNDASSAVALNCGIGSRSLKALVNALDKLHTVRGANCSICGSKYWA